MTFCQKEPEKKVEVESDGAKQDETQHKPKWMPPGHAGYKTNTFCYFVKIKKL